jgi:hypothetical protein
MREETMSTSKPMTGTCGAALLALTLAACGSASNSETPGTGGGGPRAAGSGGGAPMGTGGGSGAGGGGGASGSGGSPGTRPDGGTRTPDTAPGGSSDANAAPPGACPVRSSLTLAVHIIMDASWPGTTAASAGMDKIHLWNLTKLNVNGNEVSGNETRSCGTVLPPFSLNGAGQLVTGGRQVHVEIPFAVWEAPSIPRLRSQGRLAGWNPGSAFNIEGTVALIGLDMADPMAAWPMSYTGIMAVDADGDGKPGFTAVPKAGNGFVQPPTGLGLFGSAPSADQVYIASRTVVSLEGMLTSCTEVAGTARVPFFDSHVVGCHVKGGAECTPNQIDFVDGSRTIYKIGSATFTAKQIPDNATCADVRAALP